MSESESPSVSGPACGAKCGITREREREKATARALVARAYPELCWAPAPAWTPEEAPIGIEEISTLALSLEQVLPARALLSVGEPGLADSIYLLAGLHAPCWMEVRAEPSRAQSEAIPPSAETYLRVAFSSLGRYYTLQEVRVSAALEPDGVWVEEQGIVGVEDRRLQLFVKATQGLLRKRRLVALDAAFLVEKLHDPCARGLEAIGAAPMLWTALFENTPPGRTRGEWLALERTGA